MNAHLSSPWPLSAPASLVLLWGPETRDALALSMAILEIAVRNDLLLRYVEVRRWFFYRRSKLVLTGNIDPDIPAYPSLSDVLTAFRPPGHYGKGIVGVPIDEIGKHFLSYVKAFHAEPKRSLPTFDVRNGYVQASVMSELEEWQLYARQRNDGLFPSMQWVLTDKGAGALEVLQEHMDVGRTVFQTWVTEDPRRAMEFLERAGSAVLLMRGLAGSYRRLLQTGEGDRRSWDQMSASAIAGQSTRPGGEAIGVRLLARPRGPYPVDDIDRAMYEIVDELDRVWSRARRFGFSVGGE